jgi:hypothetical protein
LEVTMKVICIVLSVSLAAGSHAFAQVSGGSSAGTSAGSAAANGSAGSTLSNGSTINGTGGSPGPNTANALSRGTTGNVMGGPHTSRPDAPAASHGNAVDTPAANAAAQSLGNTDAGVLKK